MTTYLKKQIEEIQKSPILSLYGAALVLTHFWTFMYWNRGSFFVTAQSAINAEPLCFPFFANCDLFRAAIPQSVWGGVLGVYFILTAIGFLSFLGRGLIQYAYWILVSLTALKFFLHMSNYNFMGNYHYMIYFASLAYLFLPHKLATLRYLLVAFYVAAGTLKFNIDWLSGAAMIQTPLLRGQTLVASLYYVVLLEVVFIFGLLHSNRWVRTAILLQLLAFHAFSWHIVGFYYPMVMFCLLSLLFFEEWHFYKTKTPIEADLTKLLRLKMPKSTLALLGLFIAMQILPFLLSSDPALSGVPRLSSLNMFDSKTQCETLMVAHTDKGTIHLRKPIKNLGTRLKCDPLVFLNQAHQICRQNRKTNEINRLSFSLYSKRITEIDYKKILDIKDVCAMKNPLWAELDPS